MKKQFEILLTKPLAISVGALIVLVGLMACGPAAPNEPGDLRLPPAVTPNPSSEIAASRFDPVTSSNLAKKAQDEVLPIANELSEPMASAKSSELPEPTEVSPLDQSTTTSAPEVPSNTPLPLPTEGRDVTALPAAQADDSADDSTDPPAEPEPDKEPEATPTPVPPPTRCYTWQDSEKCFVVPLEPVVQHPNLGGLGIPAQRAEDAVREAQKRGETARSVVVPNYIVKIIMHDDVSATATVKWLKTNGIPDDAVHADPDGWANRLIDRVPAIYGRYIDTFDDGYDKPEHIIAVLPASMLIPVSKLEDVRGLEDAERHYVHFYG